jgi:hypothetical protein
MPLRFGGGVRGPSDANIEHFFLMLPVMFPFLIVLVLAAR